MKQDSKCYCYSFISRVMCRFCADADAELSSAVGDKVGRLQQQVRLWLSVVRWQRRHSVQWYHSHVASYRWQVLSDIHVKCVDQMHGSVLLNVYAVW